MTLSDQVLKNIITRLLNGEDYRIEVLNLLNAQFLDYVIDFFKKVVDAKFENEKITLDWYKKVFLSPDLRPKDVAIHAGLNKKTISNMHNSARREIVLDAAINHYDTLRKLVDTLVEHDDEFDVTLSIKFRDVSVKLSINECLIVINSLAVKRSALRGGLWSTAGKRVEKPLMRTLCELYTVPATHYRQPDKKAYREVDFYLVGQDKEEYKCEVKLMGKGNPESADMVIARGSHVFVADKLSDLNKDQLDGLDVHWVELRQNEGYKRFQLVLEQLNIPHTVPKEDLSIALPRILDNVL